MAVPSSTLDYSSSAGLVAGVFPWIEDEFEI